MLALVNKNVKALLDFMHKILTNISFYWIICINVRKDEKKNITWNEDSTSLFWYESILD